MSLSISEEPGSAAHSPTSTAFGGLSAPFGWCPVHLVRFRAVSHHVWWLPMSTFPCITIIGIPGWVPAGATQPGLPLLQPESSSAVVEMREGSNVLSYQWVYLWIMMPACNWCSTFVVYNYKVRTSWDKPSFEP